MLLETNNVANVAQGDLYRETGAGSPLTIGTTATVNSLTTTLVSANVSVAFQPGAVAGVFTARCWINTPNGNDYVTCRSAWVEVTP
jgi:hypothetical protein